MTDKETMVEHLIDLHVGLKAGQRITEQLQECDSVMRGWHLATLERLLKDITRDVEEIMARV